MKQLCLFILLFVFTFFSCNTDKSGKPTVDTFPTEIKDNSMAAKNLAASHIVNDAFKSGDTSRINEAIANDFVDHTETGEKNRDSLKAMILMTHRQFPGMKMEVLKELADDEYVFSLMRWTGTSDGQMGMPKGPYDMRAIEVIKFREGKAVEHWTYVQPPETRK